MKGYLSESDEYKTDAELVATDDEDEVVAGETWQPGDCICDGWSEIGEDTKDEGVKIKVSLTLKKECE